MKKQSLIFLTCGALAFAGIFASCGDDNKKTPTTDFAQLESDVLSSFVSTIGTPVYADFKIKAEALNSAVITLANNPTPDNQTAARNAWKAIRVVWEQSEGFLIGPVEDNNYDPYMDTWPTDHNELDQLINGSQALDAASLGGFTDEETQLTLRGFHPLEYLLWKSDVNYQPREIEYMKGLAGDILNNVNGLNEAWPVFTQELIKPGEGSSRYENKKEALSALATGFVDICNEVGESKMAEPFALPGDSTIAESPYSHNSMIDFKNNIQGAYNVYLCKYSGNSGKSLSDLVAANNKTLDQTIKQKFEAALTSFDQVNGTFEQAIYSQRSAVQNIISAIKDLKESVDVPLHNYIQQYVKD